MLLNNKELLCLVKLLEERKIYSIEIIDVSKYLVNEGYIRNEEDVISHIKDIYCMENVPDEWLDFETVLRDEEMYEQIGEDCFINVMYLDDDLEEIKEELLVNKWIKG